jgi:hypothetical protein
MHLSSMTSGPGFGIWKESCSTVVANGGHQKVERAFATVVAPQNIQPSPLLLLNGDTDFDSQH